MKRTITLSLIFSFIILLSNCKPSEDEPKKAKLTINQAELSLGFRLLETNCFSCHNPETGTGNRIAPPMKAIKRHYVDKSTSLEQFTKELTKFVQDPSEDISKMPDALKKFGIMPKMSFMDKQLKAIALYIYTSKMEDHDWFEKHYKEEKEKHMQGSSNIGLSDIEIGLQYALATKSVLGKNLMGAIKTKGVESALSFCNVNAFTLTDSMANTLNTRIKRVSDKNRNPKNNASLEELAYISKSKNLLSKSQKVKPEIHEVDGKKVGYYPIMTNKMCLKCHGEPNKQILEGTLSKINSLYPEDKAVGYGENELRGIWVVEINTKK